LGTLWVISHDEAIHFDSGDARVTTELAAFAGLALKMIQDASVLRSSEERLQLALHQQEMLTREMSHRVRTRIRCSRVGFPPALKILQMQVHLFGFVTPRHCSHAVKLAGIRSPAGAGLSSGIQETRRANAQSTADLGHSRAARPKKARPDWRSRTCR
jgi:hypothetical protein